jgi:hypothetical protein
MPYTIEDLIDGQDGVVFARKNDSALEALELMAEGEFSQLPVLDDEDLLLGMVTHESILHAVRGFKTPLDNLYVRDGLVDAPVRYLDDNLFDLLDELNRANAVVVLSPNKQVAGIVTSYDANRFMRRRTEDLMHIEDIEFTIKELIKMAYANEREEVDYQRLTAAFDRPAESFNSRTGNRKPRTFDKLTFVDYIHLLINKDTWDFFAPILMITRDDLLELLEGVRATRNELVHFRGKLSAGNRDQLRYCANWLKGRFKEIESERFGFGPKKPPSRGESKSARKIVREKPMEYSTTQASQTESGNTLRYDRLTGWLAGQSKLKVLLSFKEIESLMDSPLPGSAYRFRAWWANDPEQQPHSTAWLNSGWQAAYVDMQGRTVIFTRPNSGERRSKRSKEMFGDERFEATG